MSEWHPITREDDPVIVEWKPTGLLNVRAKLKGDTSYYYGKANKAEYAYAVGWNLLKVRHKHKEEESEISSVPFLRST